MTIATF